MIGDLVGSRRGPSDLHGRLQRALDQTNEWIFPVQPLAITLGDEFQGVYRKLGHALNATLALRLLLCDVTESRFGIGWGGFTRWNPEHFPFEQDGPAWWAAREALESAKRSEVEIGNPDGWRTAVRFARRGDSTSATASDEDFAAPDAAPGVDISLRTSLQSLLMLRDHVLGRLDRTDVGLVLALLRGATAVQAAGRVGISQQAASRRLRKNGGYALLHIWRSLDGSE